MTDLNFVELSKNDEIAWVALSAEETRNALSVPMQEELIAVFDQLATDHSIHTVILTGTGKGFSSGADLSGLQAQGQETLGETVSRLMDKITHQLILKIRQFPKPVIAAVNGSAAGAGCSLALACDIVIAAESAFFLFPFAPNLGLIPDCGATWHLARRIGPARAMTLSLTGERLSARKATEFGLISEVVNDAGLLDRANALAKAVAAAPAHIIVELRSAFDAALGQDFEPQLEYERQRQKVLLDSEAFAEGTRAFLEKRKPQFRGKVSQ